MTLKDYYEEIDKQAKANPRWRYGQTAFNVLYLARPDLSEQVRATHNDPFFADSTQDPVWARFTKFIEQHW